MHLPALFFLFIFFLSSFRVYFFFCRLINRLWFFFLSLISCVVFLFPIQNLDNWKSGRRKRVEHIIDRVVEAKKLEMEELDRNRKKSKTFSEMMEER